MEQFRNKQIHVSCMWSQASQEVSRAIGLDYPASPREQAAHQLERPLDRFLMPLADTLALRMGAKVRHTHTQPRSVWAMVMC